MTVNIFIISISKNSVLLNFLFVVVRAPNQHIRMISEGSCDVEDWSNHAENSALNHTEINDILKYIPIEQSYFKLQKYFTILLFLLYFLIK